MTCLQAQSLITKYVNDEIDFETLELFLQHINNCADCKEELEVYYMLLTGMKQLDEDRMLSSDFHLGFINKLKKSEEKIFQKKFNAIRRKVFLYVAIVLLSSVISDAGGSFEQNSVENTEVIEKSNFELPHYVFKYEMNHMERMLKQYRP